MKLRCFNRDGMARFSSYRASLTLEPTLEPPLELLEDPALTELLPGDVDVPKQKFTNRLEAGIFLNEFMDEAGIQLPERNQGLWTWLTLYFFDEVDRKSVV